MNVSRAFNLSEDSSAGDTNRAALQRGLDAGAPGLAWDFRGGTSDTKPYYLSSTLELPADVGRTFRGSAGLHEWATGSRDNSSILLMNADQYSKSFTATATNANPSVITFTGLQLVAQDLNGSIHITGGTHVTADRWYDLKSLNLGLNQATLDRNCTDGAGAGSAITGTYVPTAVRDFGTGRVWNDINWEAKLNNASTKSGGIGYHVTTAAQGSVNGGSTTFNGCSWTNFDYGVLCGSGMAKYGEKAAVWDGYHDDHADNMTFNSCRWYFAKNCILGRTYQSVIHNVNGGLAFIDGSFARFDAGGKLFVRALELQGSTGTQRFLTLGAGTTGLNGPYDFRDVSFDGGVPMPQLVVTEFDNAPFDITNTVVFDGVVLNCNTASPTHHLVDIQSCISLRLSNIQGGTVLGGIWQHSCLLRKGTLTPTGFPTLVVDHARLFLDTDGGQTQKDILDPACDAGITVVFRNNHNGLGLVFPDQTYVTGTGYIYDSSWVTAP